MTYNDIIKAMTERISVEKLMTTEERVRSQRMLARYDIAYVNFYANVVKHRAIADVWYDAMHEMVSYAISHGWYVRMLTDNRDNSFERYRVMAFYPRRLFREGLVAEVKESS
jgi:hypothetical protein